MRVEFTVMDIPPKKHGEKSMWALESEARRVASLRRKAFDTRLKTGLTEPFRSLVALELKVLVPKPQLESIGDLDSFIAGVCDSLQAADPGVHPHPVVEDTAPEQALLIENDAKVLSITARKIAVDETQKVHYEVAVETLTKDTAVIE